MYNATPIDNHVQLEPHLFEEGALLMRAMNNELRRQIFRYIHQHGRLRVFEIYKGLQMEQAVVSLHLGILRQVGFVIATREGQSIYYSIDYNRLEQVQNKLKELL